MSQAAFAKVLNMTVGYVSKLERGDARPRGATLKLLNVVSRKGIEANFCKKVAWAGNFPFRHKSGRAAIEGLEGFFRLRPRLERRPATRLALK